ncbi:hypothetical protein TI39_contig4307g00001 [Zymoseptoria brevis]|uniref:Uncharacterized protein n=1 Tax=Zymoseptoria brevis TaxID=1047168 RepID=A0A0F4GBD2_9PEZI|nr:hypothetical protein TI39_contig4307g00001 [Zymoseptoria brevis]
MDPSGFAHLHQKIRIEQIRNALQQNVPSCPPPPYEDDDSDSEADSYDDEDEEDDQSTADTSPLSSLPLKLTINAANRIQGSHNLVPISATPLADASNFSSLLLQAVSQLNAVAAAGQGRSPRSLKVDLTINCGITVIGDRNVVGNIGLRPKPGTPIANMTDPTSVTEDSELATAPTTPGVTVGAKRKADDTSSVEDEPAAKRAAVDAA